MKPILIRAMIPNLTDATSFYRGIGPLSHLRENYDVEVVLNKEWNWASIAMSDLCFLQRPYSSNHVEIAKMIRLQGKPLWIDYDDDLFAVPSDNPCYMTYENPEVKKNLARLVTSADLITVSTPKLKARLVGPHVAEEKVVVVPNAWNTHVIPERKNPALMNRKLAFWRGSKTHVRDLMALAPEIRGLIESSTSWTWQFLGYNPWFITDGCPQNRVVVSDQIDVMEYLEFMRNVQPSICFVPLSQNLFNLSKSNIAWMEAIYGGAICVAPDMPEWVDRPGCRTYSTPEQFSELMTELMTSISTPKGHAELIAENNAAWKHIKDTLSIDAVNRIRYEKIREVLVKSRERRWASN